VDGGDGAVLVISGALNWSITRECVLGQEDPIVSFIVCGARYAVPVDRVNQLTHSLVCLLGLPVYVYLVLAYIAVDGGVAVCTASSAYFLANVCTASSAIGCKGLLLRVDGTAFSGAILREGNAGVEVAATWVLSK
jgi:hypothetical protein